MSEETQKPKVTPLTIQDLPILERNQFFFVTQLPMKAELLQYIHNSGIKENLSAYYHKMPQHCKLADKILFDPRRHLIYKEELKDKYTFQVIENAKSYFQSWIKMPAVMRKDHIAVIGWFVEQMVDIEKTCALNSWTL